MESLFLSFLQSKQRPSPRGFLRRSRRCGGLRVRCGQRGDPRCAGGGRRRIPRLRAVRGSRHAEVGGHNHPSYLYSVTKICHRNTLSGLPTGGTEPTRRTKLTPSTRTGTGGPSQRIEARERSRRRRPLLEVRVMLTIHFFACRGVACTSVRETAVGLLIQANLANLLPSSSAYSTPS